MCLKFWKKTCEEGKEIINHLPFGKTAFLFGIIGIVLSVLLTTFVPFLSSYGFMIGNVSVCLIIIWTVDKYVFKNTNTEEILGRNPIAYALFWLVIGLVMLGSLIAS